MTNVEVRSSGIYGNGLFALRDFAAGDLVYAFPEGRRLNREEVDALSAEEKVYVDRNGDAFELIEQPARSVNHSCGPNIREEHHRAYALRPIKTGEEITIDYDQISYIDQPFACRCGSKMCRGIVKGRRNF